MRGASFDVETLRELVVSSTQPEPLERLSLAVKLALELEHNGDRLVDTFVAEAREAGCSWAQLGVTLGVTKQAAQQRFVTRIEAATTTGPFVVQPNPSWPGLFARQLFESADEQARQLGHNYTGTEHMLLALLEARDELAFYALTALGITSDAVRAEIHDRVGTREPRQWKSLGIRPELKQALNLSQREAQRSGHSKPLSQHILLGLIRVEGSLAVQILADLGADPKRIRAQVAKMLGITPRALETKPGRRIDRRIAR
jgi:hypothetical protein